MRLALRRSLIALTSLALAACAAEALVRALGLAPRVPTQYTRFVPDDVLPFRVAPGSVIEGRSGSDEFEFRYEHNDLGHRDRAHSRARPEGTFRILGLGDSFTYGAGVEFDATYLARLRRTLAEGGADVEVIRAGLPRFFTEPERLLLESEGLAHDPDLVLLGFVPNDVVDTALGIEALHVDPSGRLVSAEFARLGERFGALPRRAYERSHLARLFLGAWLDRGRADAPPEPRIDDVYRADGPLQDAWREVEAELDRMHALLAERGVPFVVVHLPQGPPWGPRHAAPAKRLAAWAARTGATFVDTLPALADRTDRDALYWPIDGHPRAAAHAVFAEAIANALRARGLVP